MCTTAEKTTKRANGKRSGAWIRPERRLGIYLRDGFACAYCGRDLHNANPKTITLDHLEPQVVLRERMARKGLSAKEVGLHDSTNLVTACVRCNSARQDQPWQQYATGGAVDRIKRLRRRKVNIQLAKAIIAGRASNPCVEAAAMERAA